MSITIKSKIEGYRRAGMAHSKTSVTHADGIFSEAQIKQLQADPRLAVEITEGSLDSTGENSGVSGAVDSQRLGELVTHIGQLDKDDVSLWMDNGSPKVSAMPNGISASERDTAFAAYVESLDGAEG